MWDFNKGSLMKFSQKIQNLNLAYQKITEGLNLIKIHINKTEDIKTYLWRVDKAFKELNREILKQLKKENLDNEFKRIMKDLDK